MAAVNKDEILSNFIGITQCSNDEALRYLEAAQWNAQTAMEIFFDNGGSDAGEPIAPNNPSPSGTNPNQGPAVPIASGGTGGYESDDESPMQTAIEESIRASGTEPKSTGAVSKEDASKKPAAPSRFGTIGGLQKEENSSDEEGQAFYAGGSERSGQQIIGPSKGKHVDKKVTKIFEAARKQGAVEADEDEDDEHGASHKKKEKAFAGVGHTLGDNSTPSRSLGQSIAQPNTGAASNRPEQLPIRFYANGFTVGDGELRNFEENKEFMEHIKRGEVPPELRSLSAGGRQVEVRLEDHRSEDYRPVGPQFKPFGGAGHMLGSPTPNLPPSTTTTGAASSKSAMTSGSQTASASTDSSQLEKLAEQRLKTSSSSTMIRLRLPDISTPVRIPIDLNRTLADVRKFLSENVPTLASNQFEFIEPPSNKIKREDETKSIADAKLTNATLAVRRNP